MRERFLKVLNIQDHLKMYQTLYGPAFDTSTSLSRELVRDFWMATLLERAGKSSEALDTYRQVKARFDLESKKNSMSRRELHSSHGRRHPTPLGVALDNFRQSDNSDPPGRGQGRRSERRRRRRV